eukprot:TRINITY_DN2825_c0_g1_i1.p1 TRINITY_DN2825_c0_g1~~TRINITY_DN2825_c0_g1_i1.p1  ORF type:complete len:1318 (-),score=339.79 TRINITY_DN2825_c0_g1_i1:32-3430(-)
MTISIVSKCFALLRSDPSGRLHCTPLHIAALQSSTEAVEVIVRDMPQVVEQLHQPSQTALCPLHIAILSGAQGVVELLLEGRANPNVRTLHDVSPLHLAATTSRELCQLLMAYHGEPMQRDVMGSTTLHYAAVFKQEKVIEALLAGSRSAQRLACEGDQKKVTPLHISCALCTGGEDLLSAMSLLALGAKPWVTDVSGASAREVIPARSGAELMRFFETKGNGTQQAAQQWLDERFLTQRGAETADAEEDEDWNHSPHSASVAARRESAAAASAAAAPTSATAPPATSPTAEPSEEVIRLRGEVDRLTKELETGKKELRSFEQMHQELDHARQKAELLEKSCANQQRSFDALQALADTSRAQQQKSLEDLQRRHSEERADWEARQQWKLEAARREAELEMAKRQDTMEREFERQREAMEGRLRAAETAQAAAEARAEAAEARIESAIASARAEADRLIQEAKTELALQEAERRKASKQAASADEANAGRSAELVARRVLEEMRAAQPSTAAPAPAPAPAPEVALPAGPSEAEVNLQKRVQELEAEVLERERLFREAASSKEALREQMQQAEGQEAFLALRTVTSRLELPAAMEAMRDKADVERLQNDICGEVVRLRGECGKKDQELSALRDQLKNLQDEVAAIRAKRVEADERCAKLALQRQEAEDRGSAVKIQLETKLRDAELFHQQEASKAFRENEALKKRNEELDDKCEELKVALQPTIDRCNAQLQISHNRFLEEQKLRRRLHNHIQDMKGTIRVFCRVRPMIHREKAQGDILSLRKLDHFSVELDRPTPKGMETRMFQFDAVFEASCGQDEVFGECRDLVQSAVDGYNVTVFAYGQTGAGKTHTMYGNPQDPGLAPRTIDTLFEVMSREHKGKQFRVRAYLVEVYKQEIIDLLGRRAEQTRPLEVRRDVGRGVMFIDGVKEQEVRSAKELKELLSEGEKRRHVCATKMNSASSRSHLLLSMVIECHIPESQEVIYGKITLCDLAGSERPKKSDVSGEMLKEAIEINKSLSALGDVIEALTKGNKQVPYRNHKLTMLMQDSIGGSAKTLMFVNCSPTDSNAEETSMSLKWASRARQVTNEVKRNADSKEVARLKQVIAMMSQAQREMAQDGQGGGQPAPGRGKLNLAS